MNQSKISYETDFILNRKHIMTFFFLNSQLAYIILEDQYIYDIKYLPVSHQYMIHKFHINRALNYDNMESFKYHQHQFVQKKYKFKFNILCMSLIQ
ncbi:hypothetical protein pb186bvf_005113 [Paramecium bursaria]